MTTMIVGLGNPEPRYALTRHNLGFRVLDALLGRRDLTRSPLVRQPDADGAWFRLSGTGQHKTLAIKPKTYMNSSGSPVQRLLAYYRIPLDRLLVVHDDLDLPFGDLRLAHNRSSAGHNGVQSIIDAIGGQAFSRLRIGVGSNRNAEQPRPAEEYVLAEFSPDEERDLEKAGGVLNRAVEMVLTFLASTVATGKKTGRT